MAAADTWVWSAAQGVYYHAASGTYALPSVSGEWTYLSPAEMAARDVGGSQTDAGPSTAAPSSAAPAEREEGEIDDDVGWGGLMEPDELARVVEQQGRDKQDKRDKRPRHPAYGGEKPAEVERYGERERDRDRDPERDRDREGERDPRDSNRREDAARDPYGRDSPAASPGDEPVDAGAHLVRLVVKRSRALEAGAVAVLDAREGGIQIGRDRCERGAPARVRVREMEVSKTHALVYWGRAGDDSWEARLASVGGDNEDGDGDAAEEGWWVVDLGSTLGTYVAHPGEPEATRLSEAKCASKPYALRHLSRLTVGTTTFIVHVHDDWPCGECQLGGAVEVPLDDGHDKDKNPAGDKDKDNADALGLGSHRIALNQSERRGERVFKRKLELAALRDTLLGEHRGGQASGASTPTGYVDRSAQRRKLHPPTSADAASAGWRTSDSGWGARAQSRGYASPSPAATPATPTPTPTAAVAQALLAKQGWTPGSGLGRDGTGRAAPIVPVVRNERAGLGAAGQVKDVDGGDWRARAKQRRWDEVGKGSG